MHTTLAALSRAALAATLLATAACGGTETATTDSAAGVTADSALPGPGVGDAPMDSGFRAGQERLDSLKAAGVTPADGILNADSAAGRALATDSNAASRIPPVTPTPAPATRP